MGNQWNYFNEMVLPLMKAVVYMQQLGIPINRAAKRKYTVQLTWRLKKTDDEIRQIADTVGFSYTDKFPNSDQQVAKLLFEPDYCGLKVAKRTGKTKRPSVDQESLLRVLRDLRKKDEQYRRLVLCLLHRSRLQTVRERYLGFNVEADGRVRPLVKLHGTKTFRYAVAEPPAQQWPEEVKHFVAVDLEGSTTGSITEESRLLVAADYSQLEARLLAILAGDTTSIRVFESGGDVHAQNARDLFGYSKEEWEALDPTVRKAARANAKGFLYGLSYGGDPKTQKIKERCPCDECSAGMPDYQPLSRPALAAAAKRWFLKHPQVKKFQADLCDSVRRHHYYESPFGVRRWVSKPWGKDLEREVKNIPEQLNAALIMNGSQVELHRRRIPIILQRHDEFLVEIPEADLNRTVETLREVMERPIPEFDGAIFPIDIQVGQNYGTYHPTKNPNGMRELSESSG